MPRTRPIVTIAKNGVGAFILPCRMIVFNYCERGGSSRGIVEYLKNRVIDFAKENPQIEIKISPRPSKHPVIRGVYLNNKEKDICVKNMKINEIEEKVQLLKDSSGVTAKRRFKKPVISTTPSVRDYM
ncbi:13637_t:CDS:2 [Entrophospora sp. SA101]|nr:13637_t:CDS:2 [Entrophospora sp. SA101]